MRNYYIINKSFKRKMMQLTHTDIVCGMDVSSDTPHTTTYHKEKYYFCSKHCLDKFEADPQSYITNQNLNTKRLTKNQTIMDLSLKLPLRQG